MSEVSPKEVQKALHALAVKGAARQRARETSLARHVAEVIGEWYPEMDTEERAVAAELILGTGGFYHDNFPSTTFEDRIWIALGELQDEGIGL